MMDMRGQSAYNPFVQNHYRQYIRPGSAMKYASWQIRSDIYMDMQINGLYVMYLQAAAQSWLISFRTNVSCLQVPAASHPLQ